MQQAFSAGEVAQLEEIPVETELKNQPTRLPADYSEPFSVAVVELRR
jgi:hypothetical protein